MGWGNDSPSWRAELKRQQGRTDAFRRERDEARTERDELRAKVAAVEASEAEMRDIAVRAVAELGVVIDLFYERAHPGRACIRTGWVAVESYGVFVTRLSKFRAALAAASPGEPE